MTATPVVVDNPLTARRNHPVQVGHFVMKNASLAFLALLLIVVSAINPQFWNAENIETMLSTNAPIGMVAIGMTFVLLTGQFDLSVGALLAAGATFFAWLSSHTSVAVAFLLSLLLGSALGVVTGQIVTKLRINPLVATIGLGAVYSSITYQLSDSSPVYIKASGWDAIGLGKIGGWLPWAALILIITAVIGEFVLSRTTVGRWFRAVGGNPEASRLAGLPVQRMRILAFVTVGACTAIAGVITASQLLVGQATLGADTPLSAFAIVVIGGTSVYGGEGAVWRTAVGFLIISTLENLLDHFALPHEYQLLASGLVLVAALGLDAFAKHRR